MAVACGPPVLPGAVQLFSSPCPPRSRRTHNPQLLPRGSQPSFFLWATPPCQHTLVRAARSKPCSSDERKRVGILFSDFVKTRIARPCKTRSGREAGPGSTLTRPRRQLLACPLPKGVLTTSQHTVICY